MPETYYPPNNSGTTSADGVHYYYKAGAAPPSVQTPGWVGAWHFPDYGSDGSPDGNWGTLGNTWRIIVVGSGTLTVHTATAGGAGFFIVRERLVGSSPTRGQGTVGTDLEITLTDPGYADDDVHVLDCISTDAAFDPGGTDNWAGGIKAAGATWDIALFITATPDEGTVPVAVDFTASETGTSYQWDFGDGTTSTETAPTHVYSKTGTFTVSLILDDMTASTTVTVTARSAPVEPLFSEVWIDWDDDGFGTTSGDTDNPLARLLPEAVSHNDDVTDYVRSLTFNRGGQFDLLGGQTPGRCTIIVRNDDGRWNDRNAAGPYYGFLRPGLRVWVGMRDSDSPAKYYGLFAGYLEEIVPVPGKASAGAQLLVVDPFGFWQKVPAEVEFAENRTVRQFREAILDSLGVESQYRSLDDELEGLAVSGGRNDNALAILEDLNKSVGTRHWIEPAADKDDHFFYMTLNRNRNLGFSHDDTLDDDDITAMDGYRTTRETLVNQLRVEYSPVTWGSPSPEEVWRSQGPLAMREGVTRFVVSLGGWVRNLVVSESKFAETSGSVTVTNYGTEALIELTDLTGDNVCTSLVLKGDKADAPTEQFYEAFDAASQAMYRKKAGSSVSGPYITNSAIAQAVGESVVQRSKTPRSRPTVRMRNRYDKFLTNGLYSVVQQDVVELSLDAEQYEIIGLSGSISQGDKVRDWSWTYLATTISSSEEYDIFTLDQSVLDGSDVLGF